MDIKVFDDNKNRSATVRITADEPYMDAMIETVLSSRFLRVDKSPSLTVVCTDKEPPEVLGACVYIGNAPKPISRGQVCLSRPVDIEELFLTCVRLFEESSVVSKSGWRADTARSVAAFKDKECALTGREMELYLLLLERAGECVKREELDRKLWGESRSNATDVYICYLRKKLEAISEAGVLISVRGQGYMLKKP